MLVYAQNLYRNTFENIRFINAQDVVNILNNQSFVIWFLTSINQSINLFDQRIFLKTTDIVINITHKIVEFKICLHTFKNRYTVAIQTIVSGKELRLVNDIFLASILTYYRLSFVQFQTVVSSYKTLLKHKKCLLFVSIKSRKYL